MSINAGNVIQKENTMFMNTKWYHLAMLVTIIVLLHSCTEMAFIGGTTTIGISQNPYAKAYSGIDVLTIMRTEKSMKQHVYEKGKKYIIEGVYDETRVKALALIEAKDLPNFVD